MKKYIPHFAVFGIMTLFVLLSMVKILPIPFGMAILVGATTAFLDPISILALGTGATIRNPLYAIPALFVVGFGIAVIIATMNASLGVTLTGQIIFMKICGSLSVGMIANAVRNFFAKAA